MYNLVWPKQVLKWPVKTLIAPKWSRISQSGSLHKMSWRFNKRPWMLMWLALRTGDVTVENPCVCCTITNAARALAVIRTSKQMPFFACTTCRKLPQNASKCTNIVQLWQVLGAQGVSLSKWHQVWLKRDARCMGHMNQLKDKAGTNRSSVFWMDSTDSGWGREAQVTELSRSLI